MSIDRREAVQGTGAGLLATIIGSFVGSGAGAAAGAGVVFLLNQRNQEKVEAVKKSNAINKILFGLRHRNEVVKEMLEIYFERARVLTNLVAPYEQLRAYKELSMSYKTVDLPHLDPRYFDSPNFDFLIPADYNRFLYYAVHFLSPARFVKYANIPLKLEEIDWLLAENEDVLHDLDRGLQNYEIVLALNKERADLFAEILSEFSNLPENEAPSKGGSPSKTDFLYALSTVYERLESKRYGMHNAFYKVIENIEILHNIDERNRDLLIRYEATSAAFFERLARLFEWNPERKGINIFPGGWSIGSKNQLRELLNATALNADATSTDAAVPNATVPALSDTSIFIPIGDMTLPFTIPFKKLKTVGEASGIDNLIDLPKTLQTGSVDEVDMIKKAY